MQPLASLPLEPRHNAAKAQYLPLEGFAVPDRYGSGMKDEYAALARGRALLDLSFLTLLRATGKDARDYLNRRLSQKVTDLEPGQGRRACLLDAVGKMEADLDLFAQEDGSLLIVASGALRETLKAKLELFVFTEDCAFEDLSATHGLLAMLGPKRERLLPDGQGAITASFAGEPVTALRSSLLPSGEGEALLIPRERLDSAWGAALAAGYLPCGWQAFNARRIEAARPWWGQELGPDTIPLESDALTREAVHFDKGCYPGQETIARISNLGHPSRRLVGLALEWNQPGTAPRERVALPAALRAADGKPAGSLRSLAWCPTLERMAGLGFVKWPHREPGTRVETAETDPPLTFVVAELPLLSFPR